MTKSELITALSAAGFKKAEAAKAIDAIFTAIADKLAAGENVTVSGFGTFSVKDRAEREGRNPATGEIISIPSKKTVSFRAGKVLNEKVNG